MPINGYTSLDDDPRSGLCLGTAVNQLTKFSALLPFAAFLLFVILPDFYVKSAASQAILCACISLGLAARVVLSHGPSCFRVVRSLAATSQCLCAIADILSFSLSNITPSIFLGQICSAILCLAILFSAVASSFIQADVIPSMSLSLLARDRLSSRPFLLFAIIGVLISAACIVSNSCAALVSCSGFCGLVCFLCGFPGAMEPQFKLVTKDGAQFERALPSSSWKSLSFGTTAFTFALLGYCVCTFFAPPWWMFPQEILLPLRWAGQGFWAAAVTQLWNPSRSDLGLLFDSH